MSYTEYNCNATELVRGNYDPPGLSIGTITRVRSDPLAGIRGIQEDPEMEESNGTPGDGGMLRGALEVRRCYRLLQKERKLHRRAYREREAQFARIETRLGRLESAYRQWFKYWYPVANTYPIYESD